MPEPRRFCDIGHEALDTDTTETMESETRLLQQNHFHVEAMVKLDKVPPTGSVIVATWPKFGNRFGFAARVFATLPYDR